ncbi:MAG TPA: acyl-CoA dehydrogenase family protein [Acidimicrobiales bacterium]|nr:acyl-CoA dehydrogenase family protein [Acidimicrobiales bacterium]
MDAIARGDEDALATSRSGFDGRAFVQILGEAGWIVPHWPVEYGGKGVPLEAATQIAERLDYWRVPRTPHGSGLILAAPAILAHGSEETKRRLLPPMASGAERWCQLFSEPGAGSDLAGLSTRAVQDGDEWVVKGQKVWTTLGHQAEMGILLARTDPDQPKHKGITYFAIDLRSPGVDIRPLRQMTGESEFSEIFLTDVRIPDVFRIGARGEGWAASLTTLGAERVALSGSKTRRKKSKDITGGKTISEVLALAAEIPMEDRRQWRDRIVQEYIIARVVEMTAARRGIHGSLTKILNATSNQGLQVLAVDLLGARATAWRPENAEEPGFLREFLRTRANSIEGGTSEINRNIVGEHVLGLPREPDPHKGARWKDIPRS